jgi:hypothetical protein
MDAVITCPLGAKCEEIKDNKLHRCAWYSELQGKHPQKEENISEWRCALAWMPILLVENAGTNRGQTAAIESFRNQVIKQTQRRIDGY